MLLFSPSPIKSVSVEIDGKVVEAEISNVEGPLFVCKWNPDDYATGIHTLTVKAEVFHSHYLSLDIISLITS